MSTHIHNYLQHMPIILQKVVQKNKEKNKEKSKQMKFFYTQELVKLLLTSHNKLPFIKNTVTMMTSQFMKRNNIHNFRILSIIICQS